MKILFFLTDLVDIKNSKFPKGCHCERSEAISLGLARYSFQRDCFASLAMTLVPIETMKNTSKKRPIIGVMGAGDNAAESAVRHAHALGQHIAQRGWILLNGGRNCGVMEASARGAKEAGGLTVGILPDADMRHTSVYIDIPILTGLGSGRNNINVLSSDVVIACRGGAGTLSEIALALKAKRPVILVDFEIGNMFEPSEREHLISVSTPEEAIEVVENLLHKSAND
jgi:uncharacterized protein (TIGR00725 family)